METIDVLEILEKLAQPTVSSSATDPETTEEIETAGGDEDTPARPTTATAVSAVTSKNIFRHPDAHPVVLDLLMLHRFELEWLEWEPETMLIRVPKEFGIELSEVNFHKINAMKALHLVDSFWERWEIFLWLTMALNSVIPDFEVMQMPTVAQCLVSIDIANRVREDVAWSEEIKHYLAAIYRFDGIFCPQAPADFVKLDTEGLVVDCEEVSKLWPEVRKTGKAPQEESVTAEQLRRLLIVNNFLQESRDHLHHQLKLVRHV